MKVMSNSAHAEAKHQLKQILLGFKEKEKEKF